MIANIVLIFIHAVALGTCLFVTFAPSGIVHPAIRTLFAIMSAAFVGLGIFTASVHLLQR